MKATAIYNFISDGRGRYGYIDSVRGLAVIGMIIYHFLFDVFYIYGLYPRFYMDAPFIALQRFVCCLFIIVSGISTNFSRRTFEKGLFVSLCGVAVNAVTLIFMPEDAIIFGILTFLGFSMMLFALLKKPLSRVNEIVGMIVAVSLFVLSYGVRDGFIGVFNKPLFFLPEQMYSTDFLAFFAFPNEQFYSSDYYPFFPWIFLFAFGFFFWRFVIKRGYDKCFSSRIPVLDFIGRHSLVIYVVHQPILYGICMLIFGY